MLWFFIGLLVWNFYLYLVAESGIVQDFTLPPKGMMALILPAFIFTGLFIYFNRKEAWIGNIPPHWLIYYQTFRILIELLFVASVAEGVLHSNVTIEGYNFDLIFACTAPIIGYILQQDYIKYRKLALAWNYLGLGVIASIIFVFITTIFFPGFYGSETQLMPKAFGTYPYVIVAGFLMPSAVFMHVLSIVQLNKKKNG